MHSSNRKLSSTKGYTNCDVHLEISYNVSVDVDADCDRDAGTFRLRCTRVSKALGTWWEPSFVSGFKKDLKNKQERVNRAKYATHFRVQED